MRQPALLHSPSASLAPSATPLADVKARSEQLLARVNAVVQGISTPLPTAQSYNQQPARPNSVPYALPPGYTPSNGGLAALTQHTPVSARRQTTRREDGDTASIALLQVPVLPAFEVTAMSAEDRDTGCPLSVSCSPPKRTSDPRVRPLENRRGFPPPRPRTASSRALSGARTSKPRQTGQR